MEKRQIQGLKVKTKVQKNGPRYDDDSAKIKMEKKEKGNESKLSISHVISENIIATVSIIPIVVYCIQNVMRKRRNTFESKKQFIPLNLVRTLA